MGSENDLDFRTADILYVAVAASDRNDLYPFARSISGRTDFHSPVRHRPLQGADPPQDPGKFRCGAKWQSCLLYPREDSS